jgi:chromosome segregation ATPase
MTRLDLTRAMLEKADEVDDEACMLMRWAVSRIRRLEEKDMAEIVNKERGASWKGIAEEMQSARDALQADLNRANERIWELEAERNALFRDACAHGKTIAQRNSLLREIERLHHACQLALERIDHIGCHNCGTNGRPSPCKPCADAIVTIHAAMEKSNGNS